MPNHKNSPKFPNFIDFNFLPFEKWQKTVKVRLKRGVNKHTAHKLDFLYSRISNSRTIDCKKVHDICEL